MTSLKQIEANRRNAQKSTGPITLAGKQRSRRNALRHGLTAETVIEAFESAEDYAAFEAEITAEFDPQSTIAFELVARLASLLWRLRRATTIETGLFDMQADPFANFRRSFKSFSLANRAGADTEAPLGTTRFGDANSAKEQRSNGPVACTNSSSLSLAQCYSRLANQPSLALDRLSRYEVSLWRQAEQLIYVLSNLRRP